MFLRLLFLALVFTAVNVRSADAPTSREETAWQAVNIDRTFKGYPDKATPEELAGLKKKRAGEYEQIAAQFENFRKQYPESKHAWTASVAQIDYLQDAFMLGQTNWFEPLDKLTSQLLLRTDLSLDWKVMHELKRAERQAWLATRGHETDFAAERMKRYVHLLGGKIDDEAQKLMGTHILEEVESLPDAKLREATAKAVTGATKNHEVTHLAEQVLTRSPYIGKPLNLKFTSADGRQVDTAQLKGKVVMLVFWATWCGPCRAELPHLKEEYAEHHKEGLEIIGISLDTEKKKLLDFVKKESVPWPQFFDGKMWDNQYAQQFGIEAVPTVFLLNKQGVLVDTGVQGISFEDLLNAP